MNYTDQWLWYALSSWQRWQWQGDDMARLSTIMRGSKNDAAGLSEYQLCVRLVDWVRQNYPELIAERRFFAVPSGELRNKATASKLAASGVIRGVSDYALVKKCEHNDGIWPMLWLEIKTPTGRPSDEQIEFLDTVRSDGHCGIVAYGLAESKTIITAWMNGYGESIGWMQASDKKRERNAAYKQRGENSPRY